MEFKQLKLIAPILEALEEQGYTAPTPIQEKAIPPALEGRDVLGCAQTGTGKTCAFAVPILQRLNENPVPGHPVRALILTPTRELAIQIQESFQAYGAHLKERSVVIFGGVGQGPQAAALKQGADILVATPGRLADLYGQKLIDLSRLEIFVLDEADRMLDMGFIHDVKKILAWLPKEKQTLFFSATMPKEITDLVNSLLKNPVRVAVNPVSSPVEVIEQKVYLVDKGNKTKLLISLLEDEAVKSALVFTRTKHGANKVAGDLTKAGVSAAAIHGNKSQTARQAALAGFKAGDIRVLVATDIAARGLDIEYLSHVFNYNLPEVPETYVHRIGRTGRAGHDGVAVSLCDFGEKPLLKEIEKLMGRTVPVVEGHPWPMQVFEAPLRDKNGRVVNPEDAEARAAAKERRRQRQEAALRAKQEKQEKAAQPVQAQEEARKKPAKRRRRGKTGAAETGAAVPVPVPAAQPVPTEEKPSRKKKKPAPAATPVVSLQPEPSAEGGAPTLANWTRRDPLGAERVMDATARLLSSRSVRPVQAEKSQAGGKGKGKRLNTKKTEEKVPPAAQGEKKAAPKREKKNAPSEKKSPARLITPEKKRRSRNSTPPPVAPSLKGMHQKDSTQQKSLMKPYYISRDD